MFNTYFLPFCIIFILYQFKSWYFLLFSHQVVSNSFATPWTIAHQASLSMGFPRQGYWSGLTFLPRDWTHVFCIDRQILYHWATWETHKKLSHVWLFCHPMDCIACQAPLSMGFPRQDFWSGLPYPSPSKALERDKKDIPHHISLFSVVLTNVILQLNSPLRWLSLKIWSF